MTRLLTKAEVCEALNVSVRTIDRLRKRGLLPATKILGTIRFAPEDVKAFLDSQRGRPQTIGGSSNVR
jgi:excisionase family DNA binding protein